MFFSIHIPKTGGTTFRRFLLQRYEDTIAFDYGANRGLTHPLLGGRKHGDSKTIDRLARQGIRVLHGHFRASKYEEVAEGPEAFWLWLRDPVERVISQYSFFCSHRLPRNSLACRVYDGELDLEAFVMTKSMRNLQHRFVHPLKLRDLGFLGIVEQYDLSMYLGGFTTGLERHARFNATKSKQPVGHGQRDMIREANQKDVVLYQQAVQLIAERSKMMETGNGVVIRREPDADRHLAG